MLMFALAVPGALDFWCFLPQGHAEVSSHVRQTTADITVPTTPLAYTFVMLVTHQITADSLHFGYRVSNHSFSSSWGNICTTKQL